MMSTLETDVATYALLRANCNPDVYIWVMLHSFKIMLG